MHNWRSILSWRVNDEPKVGDRIRVLPYTTLQYLRILPPSLSNHVGVIVEEDRNVYTISVEKGGRNIPQTVFKDNWKEEFELI